ncbi:DinB family protein [Fibrella sp. WM1]|uniref:DinB family protein n=1 Tax=Fibrella musci TaxID=3242485 RepID=UPI003522C59B
MKDQCLKLLNYELWANSRVIEALTTLADPPPRAVAIMAHVLSAGQVWLSRILKEPVDVAVWEDIAVDQLMNVAQRQNERFRHFVAQQDETALQRTIDYTDTKGTPYTNSLLDLLIHVSHHAAYHRGQVIQLIRPLAVAVPPTDYVVWLRTT